jgi:diguanylate cyclase (GGDEF)-like protein
MHPAFACRRLAALPLWRGLVVVWLALLAAPAAWAQGALVLRDGQPAGDTWAHVQVLHESGTELRVDDVLTRLGRFAPPQGPRFNLGVQRDAVWLHLPVVVPATEQGRWVLDVDYPSIDRIDLYVVTDGRAVRHERLGDHLLYAQRPLRGRSHAVALALERGQSHDLLLRVQTTSSMILPLSLLEVDALQAREASTQAGQGLFAGIWICLLLYSLAQWVNLRDAMFGFYALTLGGTGMFFVSYFGMGPQHLWPQGEWLTRNAAPLAVLLGLVGGLQFVCRTLDFRAISTLAWRAAHVVTLAAATVALLFIAGILPYRATHTAATAIGLSPMLLAVPVAFARWRAGDRASGYMLLGWLIYAVGATMQAMLLRGMLPSTFWTQHAFQLGSMAEMFLWMMVLGARVDEIRTAAERAQRERDRLRSQAHADPLTGLLNRRGLTSVVEPLLAQTGAGRMGAVFVLDLDGFKPVNDTHGHDAGDELLVGVAQRLKAQVRSTDLVARIGGDEFVVVVGGLPGESEAERLGAKMEAAFVEPFAAGGASCRVGLTIGYALAPHDGRELQALLKRADAAMYAGKQAGKGRVLRGAASAGLAAQAEESLAA